MGRAGVSLLLLVIVAIWGWTFVLVKDAVAIYGVVPFLAVRFTIGATCMGFVSARRFDRSSMMLGGVIGSVLALAYLFQTSGLDASTATNTALITGLFVVFAPLANLMLFRVQTRRSQWAAIAVSLVGLGLLSGAGAQGFARGDLMTLGAAMGFGLHVALLDRYSKVHNATVLACGQITAAAVLFLLVWIFSDSSSIKLPPRSVWPALLVTGVIATALAYSVQTLAQQRLAAVEVALIILMEPIFGAICGRWLHGDLLNGWQMGGAVLMVAAVAFVELAPHLRTFVRRSKRP